MALNLLLSVTCLLLIGFGLIQAADLSQRLRSVAALMKRRQFAQLEWRLVDEWRQRLARLQVLTESTVQIGTGTVQYVHREIAGIPFSILEMLPLTRDPGRLARRMHDTVADAVYGSIAAVNRLVGAGLRRGLGAGRDAGTKKD